MAHNRWLWMVILFYISRSLGANDLLFYVEDREIQISTSLENARVNAKVEVNTTLDSIKARSNIVKNILKRARELVGTDVGMKESHLSPIEDAALKYVVGDSCLIDAHNMVNPPTEPITSSNCVYSTIPFDETEIDSMFKELSVLGTKMVS